MGTSSGRASTDHPAHGHREQKRSGVNQLPPPWTQHLFKEIRYNNLISGDLS
jgi:hypothetical protein